MRRASDCGVRPDPYGSMSPTAPIEAGQRFSLHQEDVSHPLPHKLANMRPRRTIVLRPLLIVIAAVVVLAAFTTRGLLASSSTQPARIVDRNLTLSCDAKPAYSEWGYPTRLRMRQWIGGSVGTNQTTVWSLRTR
jgi:hypothetical protein